MITISVIVAALLFLLIGVLFLPLIIVIDTNNGSYYTRLPGILRFDLFLSKDLIPSFNLKLFFFRIKIKSDWKNKTENHKIEQRKSKEKRKLNTPNKLTKRMLNQFKVTRLNADIDTGNFPLNAQLIPLTHMIKHPNINVGINFHDNNYLDLKITTRPIKLLMAYLAHQIKHRK